MRLAWAAGSVACIAAPAAGQLLPLKLLQWNPHWQCFAWDKHNCSAHVQENLSEWLEGRSVDFSAVTELTGEYVPPAGWGKLRHTCGLDSVDLLYDAERWRPSGDTAASSRVGCMVQNDRPFVVQHFAEVANNSETYNDSFVPDELIVIGAHFPHPDFRNSHVPKAKTAALHIALAEVVANSGTERVVLIADTNEWNTVPSETIRAYLGFPGERTVSSSLERTCCFDYGFSPAMTYDRVIANFGGHMETELLMDSVLPQWAQQVKDGRRGAFHLPVLATLMAGPGPGPAPRRETQYRAFKRAFIIAVVVVCALLIGWFFMKAWRERGKRRRLEQGSGVSSSSDPESSSSAEE